MAFIRTHKTKDYTIMCNHHLNNENLSLKAKGLLSFMLSKPDNWEFSINGLKSQLKEGKSAIRSTLIEIEENGYLFRKRIALNEQQGSKMEYHIFEKPNQKSENQTFDNQMLENQTQVNTNNKVNTNQELNYIPKNQKNDFSAEEIKNIYVREPLIINSKKEKEKSSAKKEKVFSNEVYQCYEDCKVYFEQHLLPNKPSQFKKWFDTIDKLNRLDKIPFDRIVQIVQWARSDKFWSKNFLSLNKLRNTDKNGTKYVVIFNEKIRSMETQGKAQSNYNAIQQALKDLENE